MAEQSTQYFPFPSGVEDPFGHIACDDERFPQACAWSNRVWQEHQEKMRNMLAGVKTPHAEAYW